MRKLGTVRPRRRSAGGSRGYPEPTAKKIKLAPNDVLLELFDQLAERPDQQDMRYVLDAAAGAPPRVAARRGAWRI